MRNDYEVRGCVTAIIIKRRNGEKLEVLVDTSDLKKLLELDVKWHVTLSGKRYYVRANKYNEDRTKTIGSILLNRFLLDFPECKEVSYISGNSLDNRRENLRITTHSQSHQNRKGADVDSSTGVRGVTYKKDWGKYVVNVNHTYIGAYDSIEEAEKVAKEARKIYYPYSTN